MALLFADMRATDVAAVAALEKQSPSSWTEGQIAALLQEKQYRPRLCRDASGFFLGWSCLLLMPGEAELLKIAVIPNWRRRGIGRALVRDIFAGASRAGARRLFLEVREQNTAARALYADLGFTETGRRKGYYSQPLDNALLLEKILEGDL